MTWKSYLRRVEHVVERATVALDAGHLLQAASVLQELERARPELPSLPAEEAERARTAIARLADLDGMVRQNLQRLETEVALLGRVRPTSGASQYVDTTA